MEVRDPARRPRPSTAGSTRNTNPLSISSLSKLEANSPQTAKPSLWKSANENGGAFGGLMMSKGLTPLHIAASKKHNAALILMINAGMRYN